MPLSEAELRRNTEYLDAESQFYAAQSVANRAGNEAEALRAELAWERQRREITDRLNADHDRGTRLNTLIEDTRKAHPYIPAALYDAIKDPEQLKTVVDGLIAEFAKREANQGWGPSGAGPGDGTSMARRTRADDKRALVDKANTGDRQSLAEFKRGIWDEKVNTSPFLASQGRRQRAQQGQQTQTQQQQAGSR